MATPGGFVPASLRRHRTFPSTKVPDTAPFWDFLSRRSDYPGTSARCKIVTEISRTDTTKRKNVLIKAFAAVQRRVPNSLLIISIDESKRELAGELESLIHSLPTQVQSHVVVVGSVWDMLPTIYAVTDVYCTPSVMEGFGMSAQEAAAAGVPVVASHLVPFATEYLSPSKGAIIVQAGDVDGFARALETLLANEDLRKEMGENAYHATIPYFTWRDRVIAFLAPRDRCQSRRGQRGHRDEPTT